MYDEGDRRMAVAGESPLSLENVFQVVWKRILIVAVVPLVCVGAAVGFSVSQTPIYEAQARLLVGQEPVGGDRQLPLGANVEGLQQLAQTMVEAIPSRPVAEQVIEQEDLDVTTGAFLANLGVEQTEGTQFIELTYQSGNPEQAQQVVNAVSEVSSERISEVTAGSANVQVTVWEAAAIPTNPISPNPLRSALLALAVGLMLGVVLVFLLEYLDDSWRSAEEVEAVTGVPAFGSIPEFKLAKARKDKGKTTS